MKTIYIILLMTSLIGQAAAAAVSQEKLYSNKGYPYKNLIHKAQVVKIYYIEDQQQTHINCRVEVKEQNNEFISGQYRVEKSAFDQAPLASCLPRELAKRFLAQL